MTTLVENCCPTLIIIELLKKVVRGYDHRVNNVIDALKCLFTYYKFYTCNY